MKFLFGKLWRSAYVCALAFCPATHSRHRRACPCIVAPRRVGKMRTRWPRHSRAASLSAGRVGEATHPGQAYTKHLRCPHYPTWLSLPCSRFLFLALFSFLVACSASELLGSMRRTKDRVSQMSQGLSYNALLEVTAQLRLQYQELLDLQASQQCVKETVKTLARHAHATNSDASTVHPIAVSAQRSAEAQARLLASQQSVKGTVKTQACHTPATNSDASLVQPVADSAWETVKAQARHSPATCPVFFHDSSGRRLFLEKLESRIRASEGHL